MILLQFLILLLALILFIWYIQRDSGVHRKNVRAISNEARIITKKIHENRKKKVALAMIEISVLLTLVYLVLTMKVFWAVVVSNSMTPSFERGDMILVQNLIVNIEKGDIVMFIRDDTNLPVTHRVLEVRGDLIYTGGDASGPDSFPIHRDRIVGKVVTVFGKPVVIKGLGNYFILDAKQMRDITPYGQEYLFYKSLLGLIREYALVIAMISIITYFYMLTREIRS